MMLRVDPSIVSRNFSAAACDYDCWARPQLAIAESLCGMIPSSPEPDSILDAGCGTGFLTQNLRERFPDAHIHGMDLAPGMIEFCRERFGHDERTSFTVADALKWNPEGRFDLLASNCCVQWLGKPEVWLENFAAWLHPGGRIAVSILLPGSLYELRESYRAACGDPLDALELFNEETHRAAWNAAALNCIAARSEIHKFEFPAPKDVLLYFKKIGVTLSRQPAHAPLRHGQIKRLMQHYADHFTNEHGQAVCTYAVLYALLEKT